MCFFISLTHRHSGGLFLRTNVADARVVRAACHIRAAAERRRCVFHRTSSLRPPLFARRSGLALSLSLLCLLAAGLAPWGWHTLWPAAELLGRTRRGRAAGSHLSVTHVSDPTRESPRASFSVPVLYPPSPTSRLARDGHRHLEAKEVELHLLVRQHPLVGRLVDER